MNTLIPTHLKKISIRKNIRKIKVHLIFSIFYLFLMCNLFLQPSIWYWFLLAGVIFGTIHYKYIRLYKYILNIYYDGDNQLYLYDDHNELIDIVSLSSITYRKYLKFGFISYLIHYKNEHHEKKAFILSFGFYSRIHDVISQMDKASPNMYVTSFTVGIDDIFDLYRSRKQLLKSI